MKQAITILTIFVVLIGIGFLGGQAFERSQHFSREDILKIYACGRSGGEVINAAQSNSIACFIDGQIYEIEYTGGSDFVEGRPQGLILPTAASTSTATSTE